VNLACFRDRNRLDPSRNWIRQRKGPCGYLNLFELSIFLEVLRTSRGRQEANAQRDCHHRRLEHV
jgi:hypothetical protein